MSAGQTPALIELFTSSFSTSHGQTSRTALALRLLAPVSASLKVLDIANDSEAKARFRAKNQGHSELPYLLVNGAYVGSIAELQEAVDNDKLLEYLRIDNPPSRPSVDEDIDETLDEAEVEAMLASFDTDRRNKGSVGSTVILPMTPSDTPKQGDVERMKPLNEVLPSHVVPPLSPPMTPETSSQGQFQTPPPKRGLPSSPRAGLPAKAVSNANEPSAKQVLPTTPLRTPSQSSRARAEHTRNASGASSGKAESVGHKSKQSSIADLCSAIDDAIIETSPSKGAPAAEEGDAMSARDFLTASPNLSGPARIERATTPELLDLSGFGGLAKAVSEVEATEAGRKSVDMGRQQQRNVSFADKKTSAAPKRGGLFSCCGGRSAAESFTD